MAKVVPFRGIRYNPEKIKEMEAVITPPYDVIDAVAQKKYYEKNPYNVIRLEFGYQSPTDTESDNRYTRAAADYHSWLQEGVLFKENKEAIYLCEQEFTVGDTTFKRTGFFARVQLEEFKTGKILPHEETLLKPKADRLALMSACGANFSPIFAFYVDSSQVLDNKFTQIKKSKNPDLSLTDEVGEKHKLWALTDTELHQKIKDTLADQSLYIADGHHRYETALEFYRKKQKEYPGSCYILMYLVNACDPGMVILPTHRNVHDLTDFDLSAFMKQLENKFLIEKIVSGTAPGSLTQILREEQEAGKISFIMSTEEPATYLLTLRNTNSLQDLCPDKSSAWCGLDVAVLQNLIFQELLGLSPDQIARQEFISYTRDEAEALEAVDNRKAQLAFLLNPTKISQIIDVAMAGDKMPQKSTYFYPKLLTGLVINDLSS